MNIQSARKVAEFVQVLKSDDEDRPYLFLVPGHQGRRYQVELERNGGLRAHCRCMTSAPPGQYCKGNFHTVCYHIGAACLVAAETQGKVLSWCDNEDDAERLARVGGEVFAVRSAQSGTSAWGVVRETKPDLATAISTYERMAGSLIGQGNKSGLELAAAGLSKNELVKLAIEKASDKQQWYSGESLWLAEDAFLSNDSGFVRLYQTYPDEKYPKYPQFRSLAIVFWLDPKAGCWKRYTADRAMDELFGDHESAIPVQRTRGREKLFKT